MKAVGSTVYVGGGFQTIGGQPRSYIAELDASTGLATAFNPSANGSVFAIGVNATGIYMGGFFSSIGGVARASLAAINPATGIPTEWNANAANGTSSVILVSLALDGELLYVGGTYKTIGGQTRKNLAAVSTVDGLANAFDPISSGGVKAIVVTGNSVFAGGAFTTIGGQSGRFFLAELDRATGLATTFDAHLDSTVESLALVGTTLYAGGSFLNIGGQARNKLGAVDTLTALATAWDPALAGGTSGTFVQALSLSGTTLYVGGGFGSAGGAVRDNIAAFDTSTGNLTSFNPASSLGNSGTVYAIASVESKVYLGGSFGAINGEPRGMVAGVSAADGSLLSFNPNATGTAIYTLATSADGSLYVGGSYLTYSLAYQQGFGKFSPEPPFDLLFRDGFDSTP